MKPFVIAISAEIDALQKNKIFDLSVSNKYPGSQWAYYLKKRLTNENCEVLSADTVLDLICKNRIHPKYVYVIQHGEDEVASRLIDIGCKPFVVFMLESPLYAPAFYNSVGSISENFFASFLFDPDTGRARKNYQLYFPSYSRDDLLYVDEPIYANRSNKIAAVFSNKFVFSKDDYNELNIFDYIWFFLISVKRVLKGNNDIIGGSVINGSKNLHSQRMEFLKTFSDMIDLFGKNWDSYWNLGPTQAFAMYRLYGAPKCRSISSKADVISRYRFGLCFENSISTGYVTEKIFDLLLARTIPIYFGSSSISSFVERDCFILASDFDDLSTLKNFILNLSEDECNSYLASIDRYLASDAAQLFCYEYFANKIFDLFTNMNSSYGSY